jgi:DNA-binding NtrC family response regulator
MSRLYAAGRPAQCLAGLAILLVEDDFSDARNVKQALQHAGARVLGPYKDYDAACQAITDSKISCAIVNLTLSKDVRSLLPERLAEKGVPCIWVIAAESLQIAQALSQHSVLQKPTDLRELVNLAAAVSEGRAQVEAVTRESGTNSPKAIDLVS